MKLRAQRVPLMGASNRHMDVFEKQPKNVFQNSFMKSQANYNKTAHSLPSFEPKEGKTANPHKGTHFQQQTLRWNSKSKKIGSETEWKLQPTAERLDYSKLLNQQVADLSAEFKGKDVNMFKLNQLKKTFMQNNRKRRNLQTYFQHFAKEGKIGVLQMKNIVRQYGYDISDDQAKIIFKLSGGRNSLSIDQFVDLMTKDNVYFRTLKIDGTFGKARTHFDQKIHLVLKNKFHQLKQAFRIYRMRGEEIDLQKFNYVMKKLDINDLVVSKDERENVFRKFSDQNQVFNVQRLFCAIVEQEYTLKPTFPPKLSDFQENIKANQEIQAKKISKNQFFDFKTMSNLQYQNQLKRARQILKQLKKIPQKSQLLSQQTPLMTKAEVRQKVQSLLQKNGINFNKQDYECFTSYLDFDTNNKISKQQLKYFLNQSKKKAEERFQRRTRTLPPHKNVNQGTFYDEDTAFESLAKVKANKYDTDMRVLFKQFDKNKDGYLSRTQFKDKISNLSVLQSWQVENLTNYFDPQGKGYVNFKQFASKYTKGDKQPQNITESLIKPKSQSQWISTKKSFIKDNNAYTYHLPTKYSAWPQRLKRTDFSLIQPPQKAGQFITEQKRFNTNQKHSFAQQMKNQKHRIYQNRLKKLAAWSQINNERINNIQTLHEKRNQANDYLLRLTKQAYEQQCHKQSK